MRRTISAPDNVGSSRSHATTRDECWATVDGRPTRPFWCDVPLPFVVCSAPFTPLVRIPEVLLVRPLSQIRYRDVISRNINHFRPGRPIQAWSVPDRAGHSLTSPSETTATSSAPRRPPETLAGALAYVAFRLRAAGVDLRAVPGSQPSRRLPAAWIGSEGWPSPVEGVRLEIG